MSLGIADRRILALAAWLVTSFYGSSLYGAPRIELQIAMAPGVPITAPQAWAKRLGKMGLARVQLRSARPDDRPQITATASRIQILALLSPGNELILPKRKFKAHHLTALRKFFKDLPLNMAEGDDPRGRFNLTEKQFQAIYDDLSNLVDFSTAAMGKKKLLHRLVEKLATPVEFDPVAIALLSDAPLTRELRGMAAGMALALALREEGLALKPEKPRGGPLRIRVVRYDKALETWPVGWKSEASPRQLAPKMFEFLNLEISGHSLTQTLDALAPRLGVPVIMDKWALKHEEIKPDQVLVKLKRGKTYLKKAVDRILSQARLSGEMRVDELGQPFYWVTRFGEDSLRAE